LTGGKEVRKDTRKGVPSEKRAHRLRDVVVEEPPQAKDTRKEIQRGEGKGGRGDGARYRSSWGGVGGWRMIWGTKLPLRSHRAGVGGDWFAKRGRSATTVQYLTVTEIKGPGRLATSRRWENLQSTRWEGDRLVSREGKEGCHLERPGSRAGGRGDIQVLLPSFTRK